MGEFLKGTVNDSLTKVVQPVGLIPGAIFVLLNLAFVYPAAKEREIGFISDYSGLDPAWQTVVVAALILIIGYLLLNASSAVLDTLSGRTWRGSILERVGRAWRNVARKRLDARIGSRAADGDSPDALSWRRRTRFAPAAEDSAPTGLGDALLAADGAIRQRYGARLAALSEPMRAVLAADTQALAAVNEAKVTVDLMANLTFAFALFAGEAAVLFSVWNEGGAILLSLLALPIAYLCYRITVSRTISWCDAIDTTFALYRDQLLKELGTRDATDADDEKSLFGALSEFMLFGRKPAGVFKAPSAPKPSVTSSENIQTELALSAIFRHPAATVGAITQSESIRYLLIATRKDDGRGPVSAQVLIQDPRLPRIRIEPTTADLNLIHGYPPDNPDAILWNIAGIERAESRTLQFELERWRVSVSQELAVIATLKDKLFTLRITNTGSQPIEDAKVRVFHTEADPDQITFGPESAIRASASAGPERVAEVQDTLRPGKSITLSVLIETARKD